MKKLLRLLPLVLLLAFYGCETCLASNVVFNGFSDQNGNQMNQDVTLTLLNQPIFNGLGLTYNNSMSYPMKNFTLTVSNLAGGNYNLLLSGLSHGLRLAVPNDTNTYQFMQLVTNQLPTLSTLSAIFPTFDQGDLRWDPLGGAHGNNNSFYGGAGNPNLGGTGAQNVGIGNGALANTYGEDNNTAVGVNALTSSTQGANNTAVGELAMNALIIGSDNIALGQLSGQNFTNAESGNITIGNDGIAGDNTITRIGTSQTDAYIAGTIHGKGTGLTFTNAAGARFTLIVNATTNGLIFIPQ